MRNIETPDQVYKELFDAVQRSHIFDDSKQFVDAKPKIAPERILAAYAENHRQPDFNLEAFVKQYFDLPEKVQIDYGEDRQRPVRDHIEMLWDVLSQKEDSAGGAPSLIPLPKPYIVPGGRFREIYYWDSYFTMLGQAASGRTAMLRSMVDNFAYLIDLLGFIPNGNRSYFCSRSQPPFFALMVKLLADTLGEEVVYVRYLPQLEKEYQFWMDGSERLQVDGHAHRRVVKIGNGFLNRYWDDTDRPRQESYREDLEIAETTTRNSEELYRDIRAACESGWDFTSRWLHDSFDIATIRTTAVIPVDLNALIYFLEESLAQAYRLQRKAHGRRDQASYGKSENFYSQRAQSRKQNIQNLFFDRQAEFFCDLLLPDFKCSAVHSLAAGFPLFFNLATKAQAKAVVGKIQDEFLKSGGWVTTLNDSGQQWDAPNGWAPLQWIVYRGLCNYGFHDAARLGATRWVENNLQMYRATGKLVEKYNVEQPELLAQGGEYTVQHGFGWTNGVLLKLLDELGLSG